MIFEGIELYNIGVYDELNSISFLPDRNKNVVLIGGENGAGKTTIIDAIKLCLYGNNIMGYTKSKYEKYIQDFIRFGKNKAYVSIKINNNGDRYLIKREWMTDNKFKENFIVYKNNDILTEFPRVQWQDFVMKIIPLKLINFFLFDGEKIEKMVNDLEETEFSKDVKQILGITVLEDFDNYLTILYKKYLKEINNGSMSELIREIRDLYDKKEQLQQELDTMLNEKNELKKKVADLETIIQKKKKDYFGKLEFSIKNLDELEKSSYIIKEEIKRLEQALKEMISKNALYLLASNLVAELVSQLEEENSIKEGIKYNDILQDKYKELVYLLNKHGINTTQGFINELKNVFSYKVNYKDIVHNVPETWYSYIKNIYLNLPEVENKLLHTYNSYIEKEQELEYIESLFEDIKSTEFIAKYFEEILELEKEKENLKKHLNLLEDEILTKEREIGKIDKQITKFEEKIKDLSKDDRVFKLISNLRPLILDIKNNILLNKLDHLKKEIMHAIYHLFRKENFIKDLDIDISTFKIRIYDVEGREIEFNRLSAGERQMFTISFIWGLMKASGRKLPVVIDTPLGRLDLSHRQKIVKNFLPYVSHQVIVLSTNTEIDERLIKEMKDFIGKVFTLEYDTKNLKTIIKNGYFSEVL